LSYDRDLTGAHRLARLAEALGDARPAEGGNSTVPLPVSELQFLAEAFGACLRRGTPLDDALGLKADPGRRRPATMFMMAWRDERLRYLADRFFVDLSREAQAHEIDRSWGRYETVGWARDRGHRDCPRHRRGRPEEIYFQLTKAGKRGKTAGGGTILRFTGGRESDSFWEWSRPQTLTA
jgi:hypothetical protein